jgi:Skp family chaperone for outer membrane proteins
MRRFRWVAALLLGTMLLVVGGMTGAGQPPAEAEPPPSPIAEAGPSKPAESLPAPAIALLDVGRVFQRHPGFVERLAELKEEIERAEAAVKVRREEIKGKSNQIALTEVGSAAHTALLNEIAAAQARLAADIEVQKRLFVLKEAAIYADMYEELAAACEAYAKAHGIGAILRFNDEPLNRNVPESVLARINRPIVWHDGRLDITDAILEMMIRSAKARKAAAEPAPEPPPAPSTEAESSQPEATPETPSAALLDANVIFSRYCGFVEKRNELMKEIAHGESVLRAKLQEFRCKGEELNLVETGTPAYEALVAESDSIAQEMKRLVATQKLHFVLKESLIYANVYDELEAACETYAKARGIGVVFRFFDEPVNRNEPQSVLGHVNRPIVWHDGRLDITDAILDMMTRNAKTREAAVEPAPDLPAPEPPAAPDP